MRYRYVYQRSGAPLLTWKGGPPHQTRAADATSLGSLEGPTIALPLPRPGSPEPIGAYEANPRAMGGFDGTSLVKLAAIGTIGFLAYTFIKKR